MNREAEMADWLAEVTRALGEASLPDVGEVRVERIPPSDERLHFDRPVFGPTAWKEHRMYEYRATCRRVVDGDTLDLDVDLGFGIHVHERFRLLGIDTPETYGVKKESEEYAAGLRAKRRVEELLFYDSPNGDLHPDTGEDAVERLPTPLTIRTHQDRKGKYGRYLVDVHLPDGRTLNALLVREGLAREVDW